MRGLNSKLNTFYNAISAIDADIVCVSETWLSEDILDRELFPEEFVVYRCDRDRRALGVSKGGGVLLAVRDVFDSKIYKINLSDLRDSFPTIDIVGCKIVVTNVFFIYVFVIYISPSISFEDYQSFINFFEIGSWFADGNVIVVGDFNATLFNINLNDRKVALLNNFQQFCNLKQMNNVFNSNNRFLDLIFTNMPTNVVKCDTPLVAEDSYHPALDVAVDCNVDIRRRFKKCTSTLNYNFRKANFTLMYDILSNTDWSPVLNSDTVYDSCNALYDILFSIFDLCVPIDIANKYKRQYPPWFGATIIRNIKEKSNAHKLYKKYKTTHYHERFKLLRSKCKILIDKAYKNYVANIQNTLIQDSKTLWSFINRKRGQTRIPGIMKYGEVEHKTPPEIMNAFGEYFSSVFTKPNLRLNENTFNTYSFQSSISIHTISETEVFTVLKKFKGSLLNGYDGVPSFLLHDAASSLAGPLHHLFTLILREENYPDIWKISRVCPVFKNGDHMDVSNYRPISILCNFSKALESILHDHIYNSIKHLLSPSQHGFIQKRSTVTNLACFTQYVAEAMDDQGQVDVIYTDFHKAFDTIDHHVLLLKLSKLGFSRSLCNLFESYLSDRKQYVEYRGNSSNMFTPTSGVAQGSNLGPIFFLLFVNDVVDDLKCEHLLFADDLKLFYKINTNNDCCTLQNDLDLISCWCQKNQLKMNISKCKVMTYTRKRNFIHHDYVLEDRILERCDVIRDLGVLFDSKLNFINHINNTIASASRMYGFLYRNCRDFDNIDCLVTLYNSFIRSKLEYGALVWYPIYQIHIQNIENVQRKFLKFLYYVSDGVYPERGYDYKRMVHRFGVATLQHRREVFSVTFLFNLIHGKIDCSMLLNGMLYNVPRLESRYEQTFFIPTCRTNIMRKAPISVMCSNFNRICSETDINFNRLIDIISHML